MSDNPHAAENEALKARLLGEWAEATEKCRRMGYDIRSSVELHMHDTEHRDIQQRLRNLESVVRSIVTAPKKSKDDR